MNVFIESNSRLWDSLQVHKNIHNISDSPLAYILISTSLEEQEWARNR